MRFIHQKTKATVEIPCSNPFIVKDSLGVDWNFADWATKEVGGSTVQGPTDGVFIYLTSNHKEPLK